MLERFRRPSPALIIASAALFLAVGGSSFALATSDGKTDAKIAKKVAGKLITKRAPGLSVSHANTADQATSAGHATNADHSTNADHATSADSASNATQLGGQPAGAYGRVQAINFAGGYGSDFVSDHHTLFTIGGVTVGVDCTNNGSNISAAEVTLVSPTNGHVRGTWTIGADGSGGTTKVTDTIVGASIPTPIAGDGVDHSTFSGSATYNDAQGNVVTLSFSSEPGSFLTQCSIHGIAVAASS
jgi:hypothetical protein